jgi:hypothetical protein
LKCLDKRHTGRNSGTWSLIILLLVLCSFEVWTVIFREGHKLKLFEIQIFRKSLDLREIDFR